MNAIQTFEKEQNQMKEDTFLISITLNEQKQTYFHYSLYCPH